MARWYAKFDHTQDTTLNADYFDIAKIGTDTAEGTRLRNGLIASRSALSNDVYVAGDGIEVENRDGTLGTIIPADLFTGPTGTAPNQTYGWSPSLYTASTSAGGLAGIQIPADYRTRPTASILSNFDASQLNRPATADTGTGRNYNLYLSASNAVTNVLNAIITGSNTLRGPYERLGNYPSRTLFSIWHDASVNYFAWDDFTPGYPPGYTVNYSASQGNPIFYYTTPFAFRVNWSQGWQYASDELTYGIVSASFISSSGVESQAFAETVIAPGTRERTLNVTSDPLSGQRCVDSSNNLSGRDYELLTSTKLRNKTLYEETPSKNSDGTSVSSGIGATPISLIKLYANSQNLKTYSGGTTTNCTSYGGTLVTAAYATNPNWNISSTLVGENDAGSGGIGDRIFSTTNTQSPGVSPFTNGAKFCIASNGSTCSNQDKIFFIGPFDNIVESTNTCT